ncbi:MAG: hypothetical protein RL026_21 [Pseudomonadota bacterium]|jgi:hypothetical protein
MNRTVVAATPSLPCPGCNGAGHTLMSLCCGRGCATCPQDGRLEAVSCYRCKGTGLLPAPSAPTGAQPGR